MQTDVAWLKNADRKIPAEGWQFGSTPEPRSTRTSDEVGNWKRDSEISLI